jgi:hypothetical protein
VDYFKHNYSHYCNSCDRPPKKTDSLTIEQKPDGSYEINWDKEDPMWSWMNNLTSKEMQIIVKQAIKCHIEELDK